MTDKRFKAVDKLYNNFITLFIVIVIISVIFAFINPSFVLKGISTIVAVFHMIGIIGMYIDKTRWRNSYDKQTSQRDS